MVLIIKINGVGRLVNNLNTFARNLPRAVKRERIKFCEDVKNRMSNILKTKKRWYDRTGSYQHASTSFYISSKTKDETAVFSKLKKEVVVAIDKGTPPFTVSDNPLGHTWEPQQGKGLEGRIPPFDHVANRPINFIAPSITAALIPLRANLKRNLIYDRIRKG
jgi:hypothetical protein